MMKFLRITMLALGLTACAAAAGDEKAVCRTCEIRGAGHGEEDVAASRIYEDATYHFCSKPCAEAFDTFPAAYAKLPLPRPAPALALTTLDNREIRLGEATDNLLLLDFWATWCAPCIKAMPELTELHEEFADDGLTIVGVSIDESPDKVAKFLEKKPLDYAVALDSKETPAWQAFAVAAIPAMYLLDREGRIVGEWKGRVRVEDVRKRIESLLAQNR